MTANLLKDCTHCGTTPVDCEAKQRKAETEAATSASGMGAGGLTPEQRARVMNRNMCCPNCQHIS
jgi:hypothetical protein